jgi:hypothetical protein
MPIRGRHVPSFSIFHLEEALSMKRSSLLFGALCALALGASTAQAQNKLTTIFASNNGLSGTSMVFFDVTVANPVRLTGFELNSYATVNAAVNLQVYTCASTYVGNEQNASAWTQIAQDNGSAVGAGQDVPSAVTLQAPVMLPAGTYGMALVSNQGTATRTATARTRATATAS